MDRVHCIMDWWCNLGPWWNGGGAEKMHGGSSLVQGA
jgi:hypothetical protein